MNGAGSAGWYVGSEKSALGRADGVNALGMGYLLMVAREHQIIKYEELFVLSMVDRVQISRSPVVVGDNVTRRPTRLVIPRNSGTRE